MVPYVKSQIYFNMPSYFVMPSYFYIHSCAILTQPEPLMLYRDTLCKEAPLYGYTLMKVRAFQDSLSMINSAKDRDTFDGSHAELSEDISYYIASQHNHHIATFYITILFSSIQ